jgi:hypothetical protein
VTIANLDARDKHARIGPEEATTLLETGGDDVMALRHLAG